MGLSACPASLQIQRTQLLPALHYLTWLALSAIFVEQCSQISKKKKLKKIFKNTFRIYKKNGRSSCKQIMNKEE